MHTLLLLQPLQSHSPQGKWALLHYSPGIYSLAYEVAEDYGHLPVDLAASWNTSVVRLLVMVCENAVKELGRSGQSQQS